MKLDKYFNHTQLKIWSLIIWVIAAVFTIYHHEIWRDEMRALNIATLQDSFFELMHDLKNEGHPILWYIILKSSFLIYPQPTVLKITSFLIGFTTVCLFLRVYKTPIFISILYIFSVFMMWENTVMCRNYGISVLIIVIFTKLYNDRKFTLCIFSLILLCQTNIIGLVVSVCLFGYLIYKNAIEERIISIKKSVVFGAFIFISVLFFYYSTKTDSLSVLHNPELFNFKLMLSSLFFPSELLSAFFDGYPVICFLVLLILIIYFIQDKIIFITFYIGCVLLNYIDSVIYGLSQRHLGVFFAFFMFLVNQYYFSNSKFSDKYDLIKIKKWGNSYLLPVLFIVLAFINVLKCVNDIRYDISSSRAISEFISSNNKYKNAVIVSEPDFYSESISYYLDNKIYQPRENRYAKITRFITENKNELHLSQIIDFRDSLFITENKRVLLMVKDCDFSSVFNKFEYPVYVQKTLYWKTTDLKRLTKLGDFNQSDGDENYSLYEIN